MSLKIGIITSTRAEYGIFYPLIKMLLEDEYFEMHLIVTGSHLSVQYGHTVDFITADNIPIAYEVPVIKDNITNCEEISCGLTAFEKIYLKENYDAIIVLGDRYELLGICIPAMLNRIPIIHLHGGEKTEGALDEKVRHSITKMASIHFPSIKEYADRIIQMGENPNYVWAVGALGIDNILHLPLLNKEELQKQLHLTDLSSTALVTFHPVTSVGIEEIISQAQEVFEALSVVDLHYIVTAPNSDYGGRALYHLIEDYKDKYPSKFTIVKNLGQIRYLSLLKYTKMLIGNSSSGIIEAPSFKIPTINIGDRQQGRFAPDTVIHAQCKKQQIIAAINTALAPEFQRKIQMCNNPYGDGKTAGRIIQILKTIDFNNPELIKKRFCDIHW